MNGFLPLLLGIVLLAILAVLLTGVIGMARGGEFNRRHGNRLMRWRVLHQVLAVAIVFILLLNTGSG